MMIFFLNSFIVFYLSSRLSGMPIFCFWFCFWSGQKLPGPLDTIISISPFIFFHNKRPTFQPVKLCLCRYLLQVALMSQNDPLATIVTHRFLEKSVTDSAKLQILQLGNKYNKTVTAIAKRSKLPLTGNRNSNRYISC